MNNRPLPIKPKESSSANTTNPTPSQENNTDTNK
jgi:hypothetical protein